MDARIAPLRAAHLPIDPQERSLGRGAERATYTRGYDGALVRASRTRWGECPTWDIFGESLADGSLQELTRPSAVSDQERAPTDPMLDHRVHAEENASGADALGEELRARLAPSRVAHLPPIHSAGAERRRRVEDLELRGVESTRSVVAQNARRAPEAPTAMLWFAPRAHAVEHVPRGTSSVRRSRAHGCSLSLRGPAGPRRSRSNPDARRGSHARSPRGC